METPAKTKVHTADSEERSSGLEETTSNSKDGALPEKPPGNEVMASRQHAGHSSSSEKSVEEQGAPQKTCKTPSRSPSPRSSPESANSAKPQQSLKRKASSDEVPQETPGNSSRNTSCSTNTSKRSCGMREASGDQVASPPDLLEPSSIPQVSVDDRRKTSAQNEEREENTQDKIPVGLHESDLPASGSVQNEQHRNVIINPVDDSDEFFEEWAKHDEYAMCFTAAETLTEPEQNTERSIESTAGSSKKESQKPAQNPESRTLAAFFEGGYRITGIAVYWGKAEAHYLCLDNIDPRKLSKQLARKSNVIVPDVHRAFTLLARPCNLNPSNCGWTEPKLASWLLDPDNKDTEIPDLIQRWTPHLIPFLEEVKGICSPPQDITKKGSEKASRKGAGTGKKKKAMANAGAWLDDMESSEGAGRLAVLLWDLHKALVKKLQEKRMNSVYKNHMVPALGVHSKILLNGIGFLPDDTLTAVSRAMMMLKEAVLYGCDKEYHLNKKKDVETIVQKKVASLLVEKLKSRNMEKDASLEELPEKIAAAGLPDFAYRIYDWLQVALLNLENNKSAEMETDASLEKQAEKPNNAGKPDFASKILDCLKEALLNVEELKSTKMEDAFVEEVSVKLTDSGKPDLATEILDWLQVATHIVEILESWEMKKGALQKLSKTLTDAGLPNFASKILDWRSLMRIHSQFAALKDHTRELVQDDGTILHIICPLGASWTATGRAMSRQPNLQFINRNFVVSTEPPEIIKARAAFRASPGAVLLSADYSQMEMRVLACLSKDKKLRKIFRKGGDVFRTMAALWNDKDKEDIDDTLRNQTKKICYSILYGKTAISLADELGVTESQAEDMMKVFFEFFPGVDTYRKSLVAEATQTGEVRTLFGRRRLLPELKSTWLAAKEAAERKALHTMVQGCAADIFWKALRSIDMFLGRALGQKLLRWELQQEGSTYMVLQMHDEVLLNVWKDDFDKVVRIVRNCMEVTARQSAEVMAKKCKENPPSKSKKPFPFPVRMRKGASWGDMEDI